MSIMATIMIMTPIVIPVIRTVGIDPIHFGIVMILTLMLGVITPLLGSVLFVLEKVTDASLKEVIRSIIPYYILVLLAIVRRTRGRSTQAARIRINPTFIAFQSLLYVGFQLGIQQWHYHILTYYNRTI